ncbi:MAG: replication initiator [Mycobacterium sp.]|uniref:replication initiator n=1 Tax=Mycobacterium sp. TaxID=1785 RepID=UPI003F9596D5
MAGTGFCARPIHLVGVDGAGRQHTVLARCKNRRAAVCPSCSDLYAADTTRGSWSPPGCAVGAMGCRSPSRRIRRCLSP